MVNNLRVVIAAAGIGSRMGSTTNKQYLLLNSRPVLTYSLDVFEEFKPVDEIIIVANSRETEYCEKEIVQKYGYKKISKVIAGGKERQDSVWTGLKHLGEATDFVAVHDGARPILTSELLKRVFEAAREWGAAVPGIPVRDTLKIMDKNGFVKHTLDRSSIMAIQTPQIFDYDKLRRAYKKAYEKGFTGTDDASVFENHSGGVKIVSGDYKNIKITTPEDLIIAQGLLNGKG